MLKRLLITALISGAVAGFVVAAAQAVWVSPLIAEAETYEQAAAGAETVAAVDAAWEPGDGFERVGLTVLADVLSGVGFALVLAGAFVLSRRAVDWRRGLLWGLAGYAVFSLAPAIGIPPYPPGVDAGPLGARQMWWFTAVGGALAGLALLVFATSWPVKIGGAVVIVLPHIVGPPVFEITGAAPPELIDSFMIASLGTTLTFWLALGGVGGLVFRKLTGSESRPATA